MFVSSHEIQHCTKNEVFPLRISLVNVTKSAVSADLVTFTEDILNSKLHFFVQCKVFIAQSEVKAKNDKIPQN